MEKLNLNKLVANDIVNYGIDKTNEFQYIVSLKEFLNEYDESTKKYISSNIYEIYEAIKEHEGIADVSFNQVDNEIDMVFYIDYILSPLEKNIYSKLVEENHSSLISIENVRSIAEKVETSNYYNKLIDDIVGKEYETGGLEL